MLPVSFRFSRLSESLKPGKFFLSIVPAGGQEPMIVCPGQRRPDDMGVKTYLHGCDHLLFRVCFDFRLFYFPTWQRAKPSTLVTFYSTRLSQSGHMFIWTSHSVRTEIQTGSFRYLTLCYIYFWKLVSHPYGGPEHLPHEY